MEQVTSWRVVISKDKPYASGKWTKARFNSFIKSLLRSGTRRWGPIQDCKRQANVRRGFYLCASCKSEVPATIKIGEKRVNNAVVDHIDPIIDPNTGFTNWDDVIKRMFVEEDKLQVLCHKCHQLKTQQEREQRKANVTNE